MTPAQLSTLKCFPPQFLTVWQKLGGEFAQWTEADVRRLAREAKITYILRKRFEDYTPMEARPAIAFFIQTLATYKALWNEKWMSERAAREAVKDEDLRIVAEAMTYEAASQWLEEHHPWAKFPEWLLYIKTINAVSYYISRETRQPYFTLAEAKAEYSAFGWGNQYEDFERDKNQFFEPCRLPGWDGTLYKPLY
jgi:hypothetical protein